MENSIEKSRVATFKASVLRQKHFQEIQAEPLPRVGKYSTAEIEALIPILTERDCGPELLRMKPAYFPMYSSG
jgi:hypothetical protein